MSDNQRYNLVVTGHSADSGTAELATQTIALLGITDPTLESQLLKTLLFNNAACTLLQNAPRSQAEHWQHKLDSLRIHSKITPHYLASTTQVATLTPEEQEKLKRALTQVAKVREALQKADTAALHRQQDEDENSAPRQFIPLLIIFCISVATVGGIMTAKSFKDQQEIISGSPAHSIPDVEPPAANLNTAGTLSPNASLNNQSLKLPKADNIPTHWQTKLSYSLQDTQRHLQALDVLYALERNELAQARFKRGSGQFLSDYSYTRNLLHQGQANLAQIFIETLHSPYERALLYLHIYSGQQAAAFKLLGIIQALYNQDKNRKQRSLLLSLLSHIYNHIGDTQQAHKALEQSLILATQTETTAKQVSNLMQLANEQIIFAETVNASFILELISQKLPQLSHDLQNHTSAQLAASYLLLGNQQNSLRFINNITDLRLLETLQSTLLEQQLAIKRITH